MSTDIDALFHPSKVVVFGASSDPDKLSGRPLDFLLRFGFQGKVYAVNPRRDEVQGVRSYPNIAAVPGPVDLAIIVVPANAVLNALGDCAAAGVRVAVIFASGFAEMNEKGALLQQEITELSHRSGMRIVGPNCLGAFGVADKAYATFSTAFDDEGERPESPVALVSQSGAVGSFTYTVMNASGMGVRYFANPGNQSDLTVVEMLHGLVDKPDVDILMGHLEDGTDLVALENLAATAVRAGKPLIILKGGKSVSGTRAVHAHTGSVAGDDATFDAVLNRHRAVRVSSMEEWADAALIFRDGRSAAGPRVTMITQSGGAAALAADQATELGLVVDTWTNSEARTNLDQVLPDFGSSLNPIDLTGSMINDADLLADALTHVTAHDETDASLVILGNSDRSAEKIIEVLIEQYEKTIKPFVVTWTGGTGRPRRTLLDAGVPTYTDPARALRALNHLVNH